LSELAKNDDADIQGAGSIGTTHDGIGPIMSKSWVTTCAKKASNMRQQLTAALSPMLIGEAELEENSKKGRKLNSREISRCISERDPKVFRNMLIDDDESVAIQILVDRSGSTQQNMVIDYEIEAALGLCLALEGFVDVETMITAFPGSGSQRPTATIKSVGESVRKSFDRWPSPTGGTPLGKAYLQAAYNFVDATKERKIIIVLTDGKPSDAIFASDIKSKIAKAYGIEFYGVVIGVKDYPQDLFDDSEVISTAQDLPKALAALVRRSL